MSSFILGVDLGTTSVKTVLLETASRTVTDSQSLPTASDLSDDAGIKVRAGDAATRAHLTSADPSLALV